MTVAVKTVHLINRSVSDGVSHNKFWMAVMTTVAPYKATISWGRVGTKGQSQTKDFKYGSEMERFVDGKKSSKKRDGYVEIAKDELDRANVEAALFGSQHKLVAIKWVELVGDNLKSVPDERLMDPSYNPILFLELAIKVEGEVKPYNLIFDGTFRKSAQYGNHRGFAPIADHDPIKKMLDKLSDVLDYRLNQRT